MKYGILTFEEPVADTSRKILHVDMDAFYASVEVRDNPSLINRPVVIAKHPNLTGGRGIVSTCNYIARQFGIHSAMSALEAFRLCPKAVFIEGDMKYYREVSQEIRAIFMKYTEVIEPLSLDEAYLDVTENKLGEISAIRLAHMIQKDIFDNIHLTCSIGVSYNKFIAKVASDYHKPNGITVVTPDKAQTFLKALPIDKFYGVGQKSIPHFHELGIFTGKDLYQYDLDFLIRHFGKMGYSLYYKVRGIHNSTVEQNRVRKSIGREKTFAQFINDESLLLDHLEKLSINVMKKTRDMGLQASVVTIKIRYENFETMTRQVQSDEFFDSSEECFRLAKLLWKNNGELKMAIRLIGVSVSNLLNPEQSALQLSIHEGSVDEWLGSSH